MVILRRLARCVFHRRVLRTTVTAQYRIPVYPPGLLRSYCTPAGDDTRPAVSDAATSEPASRPNAVTEAAHELRSDLTTMEQRLSDSETRAKDLHDRLLRALAEIENGRQRHEKALADASQYAITKFAEALLDVCDNLELALRHAKEAPANGDALIEGVQMTHTVLTSVMEKFGITSFDPLNEPFCPMLHEALFEIPVSDVPKGTVVQVLKKGYKIHARVLRPAKVGSAK